MNRNGLFASAKNPSRISAGTVQAASPPRRTIPYDRGCIAACLPSRATALASRLRRKLGAGSPTPYVLNVSGVGYRLLAPTLAG